MPAKPTLKAAEATLRKIGMAFPEVTEDFPWGHRALKVKGKAFVFMSSEDDSLSLSLKLPESADFALMQPFAASTGYGLGKAGWVTATFSKKDKVPVDLLGEWLRESYRAIAPKKLAALLTAPKPRARRWPASSIDPAAIIRPGPGPFPACDTSSTSRRCKETARVRGEPAKRNPRRPSQATPTPRRNRKPDRYILDKKLDGKPQAKGMFMRDGGVTDGDYARRWTRNPPP